MSQDKTDRFCDLEDTIALLRDEVKFYRTLFDEERKKTTIAIDNNNKLWIRIDQLNSQLVAALVKSNEVLHQEKEKMATAFNQMVLDQSYPGEEPENKEKNQKEKNSISSG